MILSKTVTKILLRLVAIHPQKARGLVLQIILNRSKITANLAKIFLQRARNGFTSEIGEGLVELSGEQHEELWDTLCLAFIRLMKGYSARCDAPEGTEVEFDEESSLPGEESLSKDDVHNAIISLIRLANLCVKVISPKEKGEAREIPVNHPVNLTKFVGKKMIFN